MWTVLYCSFEECISLESVSIPSTVDDVYYPFDSCASLREITIDDANTVYTDGDCDELIEISTKTLLRGSINTNVIPFIMLDVER